MPEHDHGGRAVGEAAEVLEHDGDLGIEREGRGDVEEVTGEYQEVDAGRLGEHPVQLAQVVVQITDQQDAHRPLSHPSTTSAPWSAIERRLIERRRRCATLWAVTVHRLRYQGPAAMTVRVATAVADADGVDLLSSEPPKLVDAGTVALEMAVEGDADSVSRAVAMIRDDLPVGASIEITEG